jgi:hypothetical protein
VKSKPGSVKFSDKAYFQSIRLRTASAACRSDKPYNLTFPVGTGLKPSVSPSQNVEQLTVLAEQVLGELKLGKQAPSYKSAQKALRRLIELATTPTSK